MLVMFIRKNLKVQCHSLITETTMLAAAVAAVAAAAPGEVGDEVGVVAHAPVDLEQVVEGRAGVR